MIRTLFRFAVLVALGVGVALWWLDELGLERPQAPALRTVHLEELVDSALDSARAAVAALPRPAPPDRPASGPASEPESEPEVVVEEIEEPVMVEEVLEDPEPFVEAPLAEAEGDETSGEEGEDGETEVVASRDQDAWARLIRRMLDLYQRTEPR